jgi:hypothetical protein
MPDDAPEEDQCSRVKFAAGMRQCIILAGARLRSSLVLGKLEISLRYNNLISVGYLEVSEAI